MGPLQRVLEQPYFLVLVLLLFLFFSCSCLLKKKLEGKRVVDFLLFFIVCFFGQKSFLIHPKFHFLKFLFFLIINIIIHILTYTRSLHHSTPKWKSEFHIIVSFQNCSKSDPIEIAFTIFIAGRRNLLAKTAQRAITN